MAINAANASECLRAASFGALENALGRRDDNLETDLREHAERKELRQPPRMRLSTLGLRARTAGPRA